MQTAADYFSAAQLSRLYPEFGYQMSSHTVPDIFSQMIISGSEPHESDIPASVIDPQFMPISHDVAAIGYDLTLNTMASHIQSFDNQNPHSSQPQIECTFDPLSPQTLR